MSFDPMKPSSDAVAALARDLLGGREQVASDEEWIAALAEAEATYVPPKPRSPIEQAARRAQGLDHTKADIARSIGSLNRASRSMHNQPMTEAELREADDLAEKFLKQLRDARAKDAASRAKEADHGD